MAKHRSWLLALPLLVALAGCSSTSNDTGAVGSKVVRARATSLNRSVSMLVDGVNPIVVTGIKGTYGVNCSLHAGATWWLGFDTFGQSTVEVAQGDSYTQCPLTLTSVQMSSATVTIDYQITPALVLGDGFGTPAPVFRPGAAQYSFYANAGTFFTNGKTYDGDFVIFLVYSDSVDATKAVAPPAIYNEIVAIGGDSTVPAPNYTLGFGGLKLVVDGNKIVKGDSSGVVAMTLPTEVLGQSGEEWAVYEGSVYCCNNYSFAVVDRMWKMQTPIARGQIADPKGTDLAWSDFGLAGTLLPGYRTLLVKHTGMGDVHSYQMFQILFPGPIN